VPYEEGLGGFHPWDSGMLVVGLLVIGMALWGVLTSPDRPDGVRLWRRRYLWAAAVLGLLALGFVGTCAVRGFGDFRRIGPRYTPTDLALAAIPALEYAAIAWLGIFALLVAEELTSISVRSGRTRPLAGVLLLSLPFVASLLATKKESMGFMPIEPAPESMEWVGALCLWGMLIGGVCCLVAMAVMARGVKGQEMAAEARRLGFRAGFGVLGLAVAALPILLIQVLVHRAFLGPMLRTTLWSDVSTMVTGNWVLLGALSLGLAAAGMAGFGRSGDENPPA